MKKTHVYVLYATNSLKARPISVHRTRVVAEKRRLKEELKEEKETLWTIYSIDTLPLEA